MPNYEKGIRIGHVNKNKTVNSNEGTFTYTASHDVKRIMRDNKLKLIAGGTSGQNVSWENLEVQARAQIDLIQHYFPNMDAVTQERASKTMKELTERYNLAA